MLAITYKELEKYKNYEKIYTDGSKYNNTWGYRIYHKNKDIEMGGTLKNEASIKTTEIFAILEAIKYSIVINMKIF